MVKLYDRPTRTAIERNRPAKAIKRDHPAKTAKRGYPSRTIEKNHPARMALYRDTLRRSKDSKTFSSATVWVVELSEAYIVL